MNLELPAWLQPVCGLLPFVVVIGGFWLSLMLRSWQQRSEETLHRLSLMLRQSQRQVSRLSQLAQGFTERDPHPYGTFAADLNARLAAAEAGLQEYYQTYTGLRSAAVHLKSPPPAEWLRVPLDWTTLLEQTEQLDQQVAELGQALEQAQQVAQRMDGLAWEVARQSQSTLALLQRSLQQIEALQADGFSGDALHNLLESAGQWEETLLAQVPLPYFSPDEQIVRTQADREDTARVYRLLANASAAIEKLAQQVQTWQSQQQELRDVLAAVHAGRPALQAGLDELESPAVFPLRFSLSRSSLEQAVAQVTVLESGGDAVDVRRLASRLHAAQAVLKTQQTLLQNIEVMQQQQKELTALSLLPDIRLGAEWLRRAQHTAQAMEVFAVANFAAADQVQTLAADLAQLSQLQQHWRRQSPENGLDEQVLSATLEMLRDLAGGYRLLRPRMESVQAQLEKLRKLETEKRDSLLRVRGLLNQASAVANSSVLLKKTTGNELPRLQQEAETLLRDLDLRQKETLELKAQRLQLLSQKTEQAVMRWQERLQTDLTERKTNLQKQVSELQNLISLDDPVIAEIVQLVKTETQPAQPSQSAPAAGLTEQVQELARLDQEWQRSLAAMEKMKDLAGPLLERYKKTEKHRLKAQELYEAARAALPDQQLPWPPTQQHLATEPVEWQRLELRWAALRKERQRVLPLLNTLSDLSEAYYELESKLDRIMQQVRQDQEKAREYERRLEASQKLWRQIQTRHKNNRTLEEGVFALLGEVDRELDEQKKRYQRGLLPARQVIQALHVLCRKLDEGAIPYDDQHWIDINGELQRRM